MLIRYLILALFGICAGFFVAGGVFTVLISVGLVPRFAGKSHTADKIFLYEEMVVFGVLLGILFSIFHEALPIGSWIVKHGIINAHTWKLIGNVILCFYGFFAGVFEGCLALAIAEMLDSIPIFARRISFRKGLGIAILVVAVGKLAGSLLYFANQVYLFGG
ncbi:MAG: hypothetical protein HDR01_15395 [Lachnospiraceae bacterium]|nr:hypothetical protein [Lachnospiraceae bacterium]